MQFNRDAFVVSSVEKKSFFVLALSVFYSKLSVFALKERQALILGAML
jgi:hypothetical protein